MTKKRKLHELPGTIKHCFPGQVSNKSPYKGQNFHCLEIAVERLFDKNQKETIYAFPNLVSQEI